MGDVWLVRGLVWQILMILRRNAHIGGMVPESDPFLPWVYYHINRFKSTGGLEELVAYYCGDLDFQLAANEYY